MRQIDDTLMILNNKNEEMTLLFQRSHPEILKFTTEIMNNNNSKFLDVLILK